MNTAKTRRDQIVASLSDKAYRDAFVASIIRIGLPSQIREMRLRRGWSQSALGARAQMPQALISRFERKGYEGFTLSTLRKLAAAFDVGLKVRFVSYSELVDDAAYPEFDDLDVCSFTEDVRLEDGMVGRLSGTSAQGLVVLSSKKNTRSEVALPQAVLFQAKAMVENA